MEAGNRGSHRTPLVVRAEGPAVFGEGIGNVAATTEQGGW